MKKAICLILVSIICTSVHSQKTDLGFTLEKGKEYKQVSNSKTTLIQDFNGQQMNMEMTIISSMSYLVKDISEGIYEMDVKYEQLSTSMKLPQSTIEYNSEKINDQDTYSMVLAEMINKPFQIKMTRNGKITEVKNVEVLLESAFSKFSQVPDIEMAQIKDQLTSAYGEEAFKGNIGMASAIYPDKPVIKGETWVINTTMDSAMPLDITTTYTYAEDHSDYYLITGDSRISSADKDAQIESNGILMKYDMTGNMSSEFKVDKNSGWIIEALLKQDIAGDIIMEGNAQMPEGLIISSTMNNNILITDR